MNLTAVERNYFDPFNVDIFYRVMGRNFIDGKDRFANGLSDDLILDLLFDPTTQEASRFLCAIQKRFESFARIENMSFDLVSGRVKGVFINVRPGRSVETPPLMVAQIPPPCEAGLRVI